MPELWRDPAPWLVLVALGAFHGVNPAMGWLFAVALGLQRGRRGALLAALPPLALGHAAAGGVAALAAALAGAAAPPAVLRPVAALVLLGFGAHALLRPRAHPRWVGLRVGPGGLLLWSFLMASAHGAGLMLLPVLLGAGPGAPAHAGHAGAAQAAAPAGGAPGPIPWPPDGGALGAALARDAAAVAVRTGAMFLAMTAAALLVYERLGVAVLRRAWVNLDAVWAGAILLAGLFTLFT